MSAKNLFAAAVNAFSTHLSLKRVVIIKQVPQYDPQLHPHVPIPTREPEVEQILLIGDSISSNIDIKALEKATQSKFVTAKAYSSVTDSVANMAKKAARFP